MYVNSFSIITLQI